MYNPAMLRAPLVVGLSLASVCSCGAAQHEQTANAQTRHAWYAVYFTGARLPARRPDGSPWHVTKPDKLPTIVGGLLGLAIGDPKLGASLGDKLTDPGGDPLAPAPYVTLQIGTSKYRIASSSQSYAPRWQQPIAIDTRGLLDSERVTVRMIDGVDESSIAAYEMKLVDLIGQPSRTLSAHDASLDVQVQPMPERQPATFMFGVPANATVASLVRDRPAGWQAIPVWNGDTISITSTGTICASDESTCFGPEGARGERSRDENAEISETPPGALLAALPNATHQVGAWREIMAEQSGLLVLFVNESHVMNRGEFMVHVSVTPAK